MKIKPKPSNSFPCSYCTKSFPNITELFGHEKAHEEAFDKGEKLTTRDNVKSEEFNPEN